MRRTGIGVTLTVEFRRREQFEAFLEGYREVSKKLQQEEKDYEEELLQEEAKGVG